MRGEVLQELSPECAGAWDCFSSPKVIYLKKKLGDSPGNVFKELEERPSGVTYYGRGQRFSGDKGPANKLF